MTAPDLSNNIVGCRIANGHKLADLISKSLLSCCAQIDLKKDLFIGPQYTGNLLNRISAVAPFHLKDRTLVSFIFSLLGDFSLNSLVLYHFLFADVESYRKNSQFLKSVAQKLSLQKSDLKIVRNFIELFKIALDDGPTNLMRENLVLETELFRSFKL